MDNRYDLDAPVEVQRNALKLVVDKPAPFHWGRHDNRYDLDAPVEVQRHVLKLFDKPAPLNNCPLNAFALLDYSQEPVCRKSVDLGFQIDISTQFSALSNNTLAVSDGANNSIRILDLQSRPAGRLVKELIGHTDRIICLTELSTNGLLASVSLDKTMRLWDLSRPKNKTCFKIIKLPMYQGFQVGQVIALSKNRIVSNLCNLSIERQFILWDFNDINGPRIPPQTMLPDNCLALSKLPDQAIVFTDRHGRIRILDTKSVTSASNYQPSYLEVEQEGMVSNLISLSNNHFASLRGGSQPNIKIWDVNDVNAPACISKLDSANLDIMDVYAMAPIPGGKMVTATSKSIMIWDLAAENKIDGSPRCLNVLDVDAVVSYVATLNDGRLVSILQNNKLNIDTFQHKPAIEQDETVRYSR